MARYINKDDLIHELEAKKASENNEWIFETLTSFIYYIEDMPTVNIDFDDGK